MRLSHDSQLKNIIHKLFFKTNFNRKAKNKKQKTKNTPPPKKNTPENE